MGSTERHHGRRHSEAAEAAPRMRRGFRNGAVGRAAGPGRRCYGRAPTTKWVVVLVAEDPAQISSGRVWPTAPHAAEVLGCRRCARVAAGGAGWRAGSGVDAGLDVVPGRTARAGAGRGPGHHPLRWKGRTAVRGAGGPRQAEGGPRAGRGRCGSGGFYRENVLNEMATPGAVNCAARRSTAARSSRPAGSTTSPARPRVSAGPGTTPCRCRRSRWRG